ncbi:MAG TPA: hypothetical protein DCF67_02975 [Brevundimonas sp.]|nr:hypothetical protein [Brevundimonas sp.]
MGTLRLRVFGEEDNMVDRSMGDDRAIVCPDLLGRDGGDDDNTASAGVGDDDFELPAAEAVHQGVQASSCESDTGDILVDHGHDPKASAFGLAADRQDRALSRIERGARSDAH